MKWETVLGLSVTLALSASAFAADTEMLGISEGYAQSTAFHQTLRPNLPGLRAATQIGAEVYDFRAPTFEIFSGPVRGYPTTSIFFCRVVDANGAVADHFSTDPKCEGIKDAVPDVLGSILTAAMPGTIPLPRYIHPKTNATWVTLKGWEAEHSGFKFDRNLGFVYPLEENAQTVSEERATWIPVYGYRRKGGNFDRLYSRMANENPKVFENQGVAFYTSKEPTSENDVPLYQYNFETGTHLLSLASFIPSATRDATLGYISLVPVEDRAALRRFVRPLKSGPAVEFWTLVGKLLYSERATEAVKTRSWSPYQFEFDETIGYVRTKGPRK